MDPKRNQHSPRPRPHPRPEKAGRQAPDREKTGRQTRAEEIIAALRRQANPQKAEILARFFKTGPGQYGEGETFLGLTVPLIRQTAKSFPIPDLPEIEKLLHCNIHEVRFTGWYSLLRTYQAAKDDKTKRLVFHFAEQNLPLACNWDYVDLTFPGIAGDYLLHRSKAPLFRWAKSNCLWTQRASILSTMTFLKHGHAQTTLELAGILVDHPHDLIHKATGWLLREAAKRGHQPAVLAFLDHHAPTMPRTALRYAIEHFPPPLRHHYLSLPRT